MGLIFSFKKKSAKIAANIGAVYLKETAVPILRQLRDLKKQVKEITPVMPLINNHFLLFPKKGTFCFSTKGMVKRSVPTDLKKTTWYTLKVLKYFTTDPISANAIALKIMYIMALFFVIFKYRKYNGINRLPPLKIMHKKTSSKLEVFIVCIIQ